MRDESVSAINTYSNKWTNYNPSDPGITLIELLCWVAENLFYRIDRIPDESYKNFLRLVAGTNSLEKTETLIKKIRGMEAVGMGDRKYQELLEFLWDIEKNDDLKRRIRETNLLKEQDGSYQQLLSDLKVMEEKEGRDVTAMKGASLNFIESRFRAVTEEDFEKLAIEATELPSWKKTKVKRAIVFEKLVPVASEEEKTLERKMMETEIVSIIIVPETTCNPSETKELIKWITSYLKDRKLLGTRLNVMAPRYTKIDIDLTVICNRFADKNAIKEDLANRIEAFIDPIYGGADGKGWEYQRPLSIYEILQIVENTKGVERTKKLLINGDDQKQVFSIDGFVLLKNEPQISCE